MISSKDFGGHYGHDRMGFSVKSAPSQIGPSQIGPKSKRPQNESKIGHMFQIE